MSTTFKLFPYSSIEQQIESHPAWVNGITGLKAQKLLKGARLPFVFLLRNGEVRGNYYVTFLTPELSIKHQPFSIIMSSEGWFYDDGEIEGPLTAESFEDILHLIMHCRKEESIPYTQQRDEDAQLLLDF